MDIEKKRAYDRKSRKAFYERHKELCQQRNREYQHTHREHMREWYREYYQRNKDRIQTKNIKWAENNPDKVRAIRDEYYQRTRQHYSDWYKAHRTKRKRILFDILGQHNCIKCGFSDIRALQFDHINGKGGKLNLKLWNHRSLTEKAIGYYIMHPDEARKMFQVLCANCNWIKRSDNNECIVIQSN